MNQLGYLAQLYEANENANANSVFEEALRNDEFARMSKKEIVELKRQFLSYIRVSDELINREDYVETMKNTLIQTEEYLLSTD